MNHHHGAPDHRGRLGVALALTATVTLAQAVGAVLTGSLALLTDTAHALTDTVGLGVALLAASLALRPPTKERTWGFRRIEMIAALGQATLLLGVGVYTAIEGIRRLIAPPEVPSAEMLVFGLVGLVANGIAILVLTGRRDATMSLRAAYLEVINDALGSLGVVIAALVIATTGFQRADAIAALVIAGLIVPRAFVIMRETTAVLMEFTPKGLDLDEVRRHITALDHVIDVHDLHASTVATGLPTITAHVVVSDECFRTGHVPELLRAITDCVAEHFEVSVHHSTFQLETAEVARHEQAAHD